MISPTRTPAAAYRPAPLFETMADNRFSMRHASQASGGPISPFQAEDPLGRESLFPSLPTSAKWLSVAAGGNQLPGMQATAGFRLSDVELQIKERAKYLQGQLKAAAAEKSGFEKEMTKRYPGNRAAALAAFKAYSNIEFTQAGVELRHADHLKKKVNELVVRLNESNRKPDHSRSWAKEFMGIQGELHQAIKLLHLAYGELGRLARDFNIPDSNAGVCKKMGQYLDEYRSSYRPNPQAFKEGEYMEVLERLQGKLQLPLDPIDDRACEDAMAQIEEITGVSVAVQMEKIKNGAPTSSPPTDTDTDTTPTAKNIKVLSPTLVFYNPESLVSENNVLATRQPYVYTAPPVAIGTSPTTGTLVRSTVPSDGAIAPGESGFVATPATLGVTVMSLYDARREKRCQVYETHSLRFIDDGQTQNPEAWTNDRGLTSRGHCKSYFGDGTEQRHLLPEAAQVL